MPVALKMVWVCLSLFLLSESVSAQVIVLRDLTRITSVPVQAVDDEFLTLTDGRKLTWDQVLQARVDSVWQRQVEQRIETFGLPLYRLKHRLQQGHVQAAYEVAQRWYQDKSQKFAGPQANFLVSRAVMLGRIDAGQRQQAVEPMLQALLLQQRCPQTFLDSMPEIAFPKDQFKTGISDDLLPVWSSPDGSAKQLNRLSSQFDLDQLTTKWPGLAVYLSSLAIDAKQRQRMTQWNSRMGKVPQLRPWQRILGSRFSQTPLSILIRNTEGATRVSAMYWWATAADQQAAKSERVLTLLKVVANYGDQYPTLAKLALSRAEELSDDASVQAVLQAQGLSQGN